MPTATEVDSTVEGFPTPSLTKHAVNTDYASIKEKHKLLTANAASIECDLSGGQNGYIRIILLPEQYSRVSGNEFVRPSNLVRTAHISAWAQPTKEKRILRKHPEQIRLYNKCRTVNTALKNQLLASFDERYITRLKNDYMGYTPKTKMKLIHHLYMHHSRISSRET